MKVIYNSRFLSLVSLVWPVRAMALFGRLVLVRGPSADARLLAHEAEHIRQQQEIGWWRFLWRYLEEYFRARLDGWPREDAYRGISFEVQARIAALRVGLNGAPKDEYIYREGK